MVFRDVICTRDYVRNRDRPCPITKLQDTKGGRKRAKPYSRNATLRIANLCSQKQRSRHALSSSTSRPLLLLLLLRQLLPAERRPMSPGTLESSLPSDRALCSAACTFGTRGLLLHAEEVPPLLLLVQLSVPAAAAAVAVTVVAVEGHVPHGLRRRCRWPPRSRCLVRTWATRWLTLRWGAHRSPGTGACWAGAGLWWRWLRRRRWWWRGRWWS